MPDISLFTRRVDNKLVGFKLGYALTEHTYYSWLGCVHSDYRKMGISTQLLVRQHQWAQLQSYKAIETKALEDNLPMADLNMKHGFVRIGIRKKSIRTDVIFQKN